MTDRHVFSKSLNRVPSTQAQVDAGVSPDTYIPPSLRKISLLATQATTSGTSKDFTIPAGARRFTVFFVGTSTDSTSPFLIQLGDAGGIEATGYNTAIYYPGVSYTATTTGWQLSVSMAAADTAQGAVSFELVDPATFTWAYSGGTIILTSSTLMHLTSGTKALSAELTTVRVTTVSGTPNFDAGLVGCSYIL